MVSENVFTGLRDLKTVSLHSTLAELGMDSMMAVEIKQTLEREFEIFLSPQDIRGLTFAKLQEMSSKEKDSSPVDAEPTPGGMCHGRHACLIGQKLLKS